MGAVIHTAQDRERLAVTNHGEARCDLATNDVNPGEGYGAEPGERVEWVLEAGQSLYGTVTDGEPQVGIEPIEERGPEG